MPLHILGCLLDEQWVIEDVLNTRSQLTYWRRAAKFLGSPSFLFLPTFFINDCRKLFALPHRPYSPNVVELRVRIRRGEILGLGFVSYLNDHYSGVHLPEQRTDIDAPRWLTSESAQFRDEMLDDFILFHTIARQKKSPCPHISNGEVPVFVTNVGYLDFNLDNLAWNFKHPIFDWVGAVLQQPKIHPELEIETPSLPHRRLEHPDLTEINEVVRREGQPLEKATNRQVPALFKQQAVFKQN
ncbi:hypothetical protein FB451DRAFT_1174576 [Mycena latifolia]|nr:hypothetical protein FB451DRAFT_1174576 [Mycena latifolia]